MIDFSWFVHWISQLGALKHSLLAKRKYYTHESEKYHEIHVKIEKEFLWRSSSCGERCRLILYFLGIACTKYLMQSPHEIVPSWNRYSAVTDLNHEVIPLAPFEYVDWIVNLSIPFYLSRWFEVLDLKNAEILNGMSNFRLRHFYWSIEVVGFSISLASNRACNTHC